MTSRSSSQATCPCWRQVRLWRSRRKGDELDSPTQWTGPWRVRRLSSTWTSRRSFRSRRPAPSRQSSTSRTMRIQISAEARLPSRSDRVPVRSLRSLSLPVVLGRARRSLALDLPHLWAGQLGADGYASVPDLCFATSGLTTVHEIAHRWFGYSVNLVTQHDCRMLEGPTTYAE